LRQLRSGPQQLQNIMLVYVRKLYDKLKNLQDKTLFYAFLLTKISGCANIITLGKEKKC
jgi:hypothetical protein